MSDIVAELDRWLTHVGNPETTNDARFPIAAVQRARDEITALRAGYTREQMRKACLDNYNAIRNQADET